MSLLPLQLHYTDLVSTNCHARAPKHRSRNAARRHKKLQGDRRQSPAAGQELCLIKKDLGSNWSHQELPKQCLGHGAAPAPWWVMGRGVPWDPHPPAHPPPRQAVSEIQPWRFHAPNSPGEQTGLHLKPPKVPTFSTRPSKIILNHPGPVGTAPRPGASVVPTRMRQAELRPEQGGKSQRTTQWPQHRNTGT